MSKQHRPTPFDDLIFKLGKLNKGDVVECLTTAGWQPYEVMGKVLEGMPGRLKNITVRELTGSVETRNEVTLHTFFESDMKCIRLPATQDKRIQGNVFADWLEENNFPEAADALRKQFPLIEKVD